MADENVVKTDNEDMHDAIASAYEEVEKAAGAPPELKPNEPADEPEAPPPEPEATPDKPEEPVTGPDGRVRDPKTGKFLPKAGEEPPPAAKPEAKPAAPPPGTPPAKPVAPVVKPAAPTPAPDPYSRAPQSWKPLARERYAALDKLGEEGKAIKEELHRREREVNVTLQKTAEQRAFYDEFQRTIQPFAPVIAANGHTPLQSVQGLMQTAAALQMGTPGQRAMVGAAIIRNYGIDIDLLAQALESGGGMPQVPPGSPPPGQMRDPRLDAFLADQQRQKAAEEARAKADLERRYAEFAETHEFFEDVRGLMATIVTVKAEQEGVDISDDEAYTMALALRPDLTQILKDREALAQATKPDGSTARAAAAAVSLKPGGISAPKAADPNDLHAVMSESFDEVFGKH